MRFSSTTRLCAPCIGQYGVQVQIACPVDLAGDGGQKQEFRKGTLNTCR